NINLEIASSMQDKTYLRKTNIKTKVLFGVFNQGNIARRLDDDNDHFNIFTPFGDSKDILSNDNVFADKNHMLAKFINYTYSGLLKDGKYNSGAIFDYKNSPNQVNMEWFNAKHTDKTSSLAQAKHQLMKLKTLGLKSIKSNKTIQELLDMNRSTLESKFDVDFKGNYPFPDNFTDKLFDKMLRLEHNRWNAYHYLNGWEYSEDKNKSIKEHDCLLPIEDFPKYFKDKKRLTDLIEWDIYSFMYLPNYLAEAGYEIVDKEKIILNKGNKQCKTKHSDYL
ncbi:MAG: hypothetical protein U9R16_08235, partial [Campylobacterota bacterium]|nr:hypothetical protein [Campylobacterota bacterium]